MHQYSKAKACSREVVGKKSQQMRDERHQMLQDCNQVSQRARALILTTAHALLLCLKRAACWAGLG